MSSQDHLIIKRLVQSVLAKSLALHNEKAAQAADEVVDALQRECGGDRLYVPVPKDGSIAERDDRIRGRYRELCETHSSRVALEMLARREALGMRQLYRICSTADGQAAGSASDRVGSPPPAKALSGERSDS
jgi:Mor family transcriptional regulator